VAGARAWFLVGVMGLVLPGSSGCLILQATCTACADAHMALADCLEQCRNRRWAEAAWRQACASHGWGGDPDFACGFKDGFAAHLYRGTKEPPALPPPKYRSLWYQNARGCQAVESWRWGFREGVAFAMEGGYRRYVTCWLGDQGHLSVPPPPPVADTPGLPAPFADAPGPPLARPPGADAPGSPAPGAQPPGLPADKPGLPQPGELLPLPRVIPLWVPEKPTPGPTELGPRPESTQREPDGYEQTFVTVTSSGPQE
jgi:hypothetical protein